ncbi:MAG TPA: hypothetical protein VMJ75_00255 [Candidatus Acidoferrales bacterium]|nr:hypothetical protein [Candidatus Acidoferrales bacterium]
MSVYSVRVAALMVALAMIGLTSCSSPNTARVGTPEFYWYAAKETYAAGDYIKTADHLDHLIDNQNEYTARAVPWSLVLTSGMAAGYMELADAYTAGARVNRANALAFRRKAADYRTIASPLVLRFAQNVEKMARVGGGGVQLAFSLPKGTAAQSALIHQIAGGIPLTAGDEETAQSLTIQRNVLLAVCAASGAPNDTARTEEVLGHASALLPRATFENALSQMLNAESVLYARDKLDDPEKLDAIRKRAQYIASGAARLTDTAGKVTPVEASVH